MTVERETTSSSLTTKVRSAVPLTPDEQAALRAKLKDRFKQPLELRFEVDPSLLGGVSVRVGDQVIDGSVKGKLDALAQRMGSGR
ncbi:MAG TPA: ATP synthase F1 subunit delta [Anaerolineae bacterium]|jgi:F-type H+-transporting ATPase subunit delta|nr:ATP synthase F1 subunit delta [Anaerolineae bacterium]